MQADNLIEFWRPLLEYPGHGWSVGTFGAIGEFHRDADEPAGIAEGEGWISIETARGALRLHARDPLEVIAFDNLSKDPDCWTHTLAFCAERRESAPQVVVDLGPDRDAIRSRDQDAHFFNLGIGVGDVSMCIRTRDAELIAAMQAVEGQSVFAPECSHLMGHWLRAQPSRIMLSPAARLEIYQGIPMPDGKSPEGPHTHLLPKLIATGRAHSANTPLPEGWQAMATCHPRSPWRDSLGERTPFNAEADLAFLHFWCAHALAEDRKVRAEIEAAVLQHEPDAYVWPRGRRESAQARITLRRLAAQGQNEKLNAWRALHDRLPPSDEAA